MTNSFELSLYKLEIILKKMKLREELRNLPEPDKHCMRDFESFSNSLFDFDIQVLELEDE